MILKSESALYPLDAIAILLIKFKKLGKLIKHLIFFFFVQNVTCKGNNQIKNLNQKCFYSLRIPELN